MAVDTGGDRVRVDLATLLSFGPRDRLAQRPTVLGRQGADRAHVRDAVALVWLPPVERDRAVRADLDLDLVRGQGRFEARERPLDLDSACGKGLVGLEVRVTGHLDSPLRLPLPRAASRPR